MSKSGLTALQSLLCSWLALIEISNKPKHMANKEHMRACALQSHTIYNSLIFETYLLSIWPNNFHNCIDYLYSGIICLLMQFDNIIRLTWTSDAPGLRYCVRRYAMASQLKKADFACNTVITFVESMVACDKQWANMKMEFEVSPAKLSDS